MRPDWAIYQRKKNSGQVKVGRSGRSVGENTVIANLETTVLGDRESPKAVRRRKDPQIQGGHAELRLFVAPLSEAITLLLADQKLDGYGKPRTLRTF